MEFRTIGELHSSIDKDIDQCRKTIKRLEVKKTTRERTGIAQAKQLLKEALIVKKYMSRGWG